MSDEGYEVRCDLHDFDKVLHALETAGIKTENAEISYIPNSTVAVTDAQVAKTLLKLHDVLEDLDDVQASSPTKKWTRR